MSPIHQSKPLLVNPDDYISNFIKLIQSSLSFSKHLCEPRHSYQVSCVTVNMKNVERKEEYYKSLDISRIKGAF